MKRVILLIMCLLLLQSCCLIPEPSEETPGVTLKECLDAGCTVLITEGTQTMYCDCNDILIEIKQDD